MIFDAPLGDVRCTPGRNAVQHVNVLSYPIQMLGQSPRTDDVLMRAYKGPDINRLKVP